MTDCLPTRSPWVRWLVVPLCVATLVLAGCDGRDATSQPADVSNTSADRVQAVTLEPVELTARRYWSGQLRPLRVRVLTSPRQGEVEHLAVREGDRVESGQSLVRVKSVEMEARRPVLEDRQARLSEQLRRWERLAEREAAGEADVTEALVRLLEVSEALAEVRAALEALDLRTPVSGWVNETFVETGSKLAEGQQLVSLDDDSAFGVRLVVPAPETSYLASGEHLEVRGEDGTTWQIERAIFRDADRRGFVTVDLYLEGAVDNRRAPMEVVYTRREQVLVVPWTAVARDGQATWVARVRGDDEARIERTEVELGRAHEAGVEVIDGLSAGDRVVRFEPRAHPDGHRVIAIEPRS